MLKSERKLIVDDLSKLVLILEVLSKSPNIMEEDRSDCNIISKKVLELMGFISNNSKVESDVLLRVEKLKNITRSFEKDLF